MTRRTELLSFFYLLLVSGAECFQSPSPVVRRTSSVSAEHRTFSPPPAHRLRQAPHVLYSATSSDRIKSDLNGGVVPNGEHISNDEDRDATNDDEERVSTNFHSASVSSSMLVLGGNAETDTYTDELDSLQFRSASYEFLIAAIVGVITGFSVAVFKLSIEFVRQTTYSIPALVHWTGSLALIPAAGGMAVGLILLAGSLPPGLRGTVAQVDEEATGPIRTTSKRVQYLTDSMRKSVAAVVTLGTGNSLGPEGPCVEIGMGTARACMDISKNRKADRRRIWHRILLSCGSAAGVAAGEFHCIKILRDDRRCRSQTLG
jgi:Voltage gated chloride channel